MAGQRPTTAAMTSAIQARKASNMPGDLPSPARTQRNHSTRTNSPAAGIRITAGVLVSNARPVARTETMK